LGPIGEEGIGKIPSLHIETGSTEIPIQTAVDSLGSDTGHVPSDNYARSARCRVYNAKAGWVAGVGVQMRNVGGIPWQARVHGGLYSLRDGSLNGL
jgi:hypothetical protein